MCRALSHKMTRSDSPSRNTVATPCRSGPNEARESRRLWIVYDGQCALCRGWVRRAKALDHQGHLEFIDARGQSRCVQARLPELSEARLLEFIHVIAPDNRVYVGYDAVRRTCREIPQLWPLLPLMYLPGARFVGRRVYRWIAQHRHELSCRK